MSSGKAEDGALLLHRPIRQTAQHQTQRKQCNARFDASGCDLLLSLEPTYLPTHQANQSRITVKYMHAMFRNTAALRVHAQRNPTLALFSLIHFDCAIRAHASPPPPGRAPRPLPGRHPASTEMVDVRRGIPPIARYIKPDDENRSSSSGRAEEKEGGPPLSGVRSEDCRRPQLVRTRKWWWGATPR